MITMKQTVATMSAKVEKFAMFAFRIADTVHTVTMVFVKVTKIAIIVKQTADNVIHAMIQTVLIHFQVVAFQDIQVAANTPN